MLFHPLIVHFTLVLLTVGVATDVLYLFTGKEKFGRWGKNLLLAGTGGAVLAVLTGFQAYDRVVIPAEVEPLVQAHRLSGQIAMWGFLALTALRWGLEWRKRLLPSLRWVYLLVGAAALIFLLRTGLMGGQMAYIYGVGEQQEASPAGAGKKPVFE